MTIPIPVTRWVILVPRGAEYQAVLRGWGRRDRQVRDGAVKAVVQVIGIPAGPAVRSWLRTEFKPEPQTQILSLGLCGGLNDRTAVGTVVMYGAPELAASVGMRSVRGLTIDRVLCRSREKRELADRAEGADVVDMESQHIVSHGQSIGVGVRVIRVVSDDADGDLPDLSAAIDESGNLRIWALMMAFVSHPIGAVRLIGESLRALKKLESVVTELDFDRLAV
jgi:hypothetical protein